MVDLTQETLEWAQNLLGDIPCRVGEFSNLTTSAQLLPAPVQSTVSRYLAGGGIFQYGYEIYLRVLPEDGAGRMSAARTLATVAAAAEAQTEMSYPVAPHGVTWYGHEITASPSKVGIDESGREVWSLTGIITYIERG